MSDGPDFETVAHVYSQSELAVLLSFLEDADIFVAALGYHQIAASWTNTIALGGVVVRVPTPDAARARALLAPIDRSPFRGFLFVENRLLDGALMLLLFLLLVFAPPGRIRAEFILEGRKTAESSG
jgi:hypothetical protein